MKDLVPNTQKVYDITQDQNQRPVKLPSMGKRRKNNKPNTRGRKTQYITMFDFSVFPPKKHVKCIKHKR